MNQMLKIKYAIYIVVGAIAAACGLMAQEPDGWTIAVLFLLFLLGKVSESIAIQRSESR